MYIFYKTYIRADINIISYNSSFIFVRTDSGKLMNCTIITYDCGGIDNNFDSSVDWGD